MVARSPGIQHSSPLEVEQSQLVEPAVHNRVAVEGKMVVVGERKHCTVVVLVGVVGLPRGQQSKGLLGNTMMRCTRNQDFAGLRESRRPR